MPPAWSGNRGDWTTNLADRNHGKKHLVIRTSKGDSLSMLRRKTPLKAKSGFKKRGGRLNAVSKKGREKSKAYSEIRKQFLWDKNFTCEACGGQATDIHHKSGRGKNLLAKHTFMACCRSCHDRIHANPAWAREKGYLIYEYKV